eukprot:symbB.v1.2.002902.t3/scaffold115.1/size320724/2
MPEALTTSRLWRTSPSLERPERSAHAPGPRSKVPPNFISARSSSDSDDGLLKALSADSATGGSGASGCGFCGGCCALQRSRSGHEVVTYKAHTAGCDCGGWLRTVFFLRGRPILHVLPPLLAISLMTVFSAMVKDPHTALGNEWDFPKLEDLLKEDYALLLTPLSFLLVYRLNRSAVRFYDARAAAGKLIETCRVLAGEAVRFCAHDPGATEELCRWIVSFPVATRNFLRNQPTELMELEGILREKEIERLKKAPVQTLYCCDRLRQAALRATRSNQRDPSPLSAQMFQSMEEHICTLTGAMGAMERINNTPLPFAYVSHLRTCLVLYLMGLPWMLRTESWWSVPLVILISYALLGVEAAAVACERPFQDQANHLPFDQFAKVVAENVRQILQHAEDEEEVTTVTAKEGILSLGLLQALTGFCGSATRWALPLSPPRRQDPPSRSFQELPRISEHIRVCVRIRPLSSDEAHDGELPSIVPGPQGSGLLKLLLLEMHGNRRLSTSDASGELRSHSSLVRSWPKTWEFDWVISGRGSQASVYNLFGQYLVQNAVEGFHSCVIACGPCGSGKSHTIFGGRQQEQQGLVPRVAEGIFRLLRSKGEKHIVKFSYLELYNERLRDLLVPQRSSPPYLRMPPLEVRQHPRVGVFVGSVEAQSRKLRPSEGIFKSFR